HLAVSPVGDVDNLCLVHVVEQAPYLEVGAPTVQLRVEAELVLTPRTAPAFLVDTGVKEHVLESAVVGAWFLHRRRSLLLLSLVAGYRATHAPFIALGL